MSSLLRGAPPESTLRSFPRAAATWGAPAWQRGCAAQAGVGDPISAGELVLGEHDAAEQPPGEGDETICRRGTWAVNLKVLASPWPPVGCGHGGRIPRLQRARGVAAHNDATMHGELVGHGLGSARPRPSHKPGRTWKGVPERARYG